MDNEYQRFNEVEAVFNKFSQKIRSLKDEDNKRLMDYENSCPMLVFKY